MVHAELAHARFLPTLGQVLPGHGWSSLDTLSHAEEAGLQMHAW